MASYNRVILLGNLVRDIELRYTTSRMAVCQNAIAVNDRRKNASGEWIDETSFVDVTFFGRTAEVVSEYLSKGSPIFVEGRLKQDTWEKDGQKRSKLYVIVDRMQLLGGRSEGKNGEGRPQAKTASTGSSRFVDSAHDGPGAMHSGGNSEMHVSEVGDDVYVSEDMPF
ncbi:MAG: single-stranded DNA-binding protein [Planctomycetota bacterium]|jgi:single-strand DNA-binding protein|nr:single-stranded DNA-binding protein [Planctomycetota bacterium]